MKHILFSLISLIFTNFHILAQTPNLEWVKSAGSIYIDDSNGIECDSSGNVYVLVQGGSPMNFDTLQINQYGYFIVKYSSSGNLLWAKNTNNTEIDFGPFTILNNFLYITGIYSGNSVIFGNDTLIGKGICLFKYDLYGNLIWTKSIGKSSYIDGHGYAVIGKITYDKFGNLYTTGTLMGIMDTTKLTIGNTILASRERANDIFIAKYDSSGNPSWAKIVSSYLDDMSNSLVNDTIGNLYITGYFSGSSIDFDGTTLINNNPNGGSDIFVVKYDSSGNLKWAKSTGGFGYEMGLGITQVHANKFYLLGTFTSDTINLWGNQLIDTTGNGKFVAKMDTLGNVIWAKKVYCSDDIYGDNNGNFYITGNYNLSIIKYNSFGDTIWTYSDGYCYSQGAAYQSCGYGYKITMDKSNSLFITGVYLCDSIILGNYTLVNSTFYFGYPDGNWSDVFVAKISNTETEIKENFKENQFVFFPNPAKNNIYIKSTSNSNLSGINNITIFDINGKPLINQKISSENTVIDISSLTNGVYIVKYYNNESIIVNKLIKQ